MTKSYNKEDTIFVQIASYRDPELQYTIQDLFKKSKRPENIFVGICHQYDMKGRDEHLFEIPFSENDQIRIDEVDYRESNGCCWARNRVQKFYRDEKWTLSIDSHMRFEEGWDEIAVLMSKSLIADGYKKPVLSHYPPDYEGKGWNYKCKNHLLRMRPRFGYVVEDRKLPSLGQPPILFGKYNRPVLTSVVAAGCWFSLGEVNKEIIYDENIYFIGEEISLSARLWTSGYDIFCPNKIIMYHLYLTGENDSGLKIQDSNKHKKDSKRSKSLNLSSISRIKNLLNIKKNRESLNLIYGLGSVRSLRDYERFSGVDFKNSNSRERTKTALFENFSGKNNTNAVKDIFYYGED